jgi:hypothetical protein
MNAKNTNRKNAGKATQLIIWLLLPIMLVCLIGCSSYESNIPTRSVYIKRNINTYKLNSYGSYLYISSKSLSSDEIGYGGILIVYAFDGNYYAFDLACPVEVNENVRIGKPDGSLISKCDSCGERYDLSYGLGTPLNHISKQSLKRYSVSTDDYNNIIVTK